jgi:hypothetical protein
MWCYHSTHDGKGCKENSFPYAVPSRSAPQNCVQSGEESRLVFECVAGGSFTSPGKKGIKSCLDRAAGAQINQRVFVGKLLTLPIFFALGFELFFNRDGFLVFELAEPALYGIRRHVKT